MSSEGSFQRLEALFHELDALTSAERTRRLVAAGRLEAMTATETRLISALPEQDPRALAGTRAECARALMDVRLGLARLGLAGLSEAPDTKAFLDRSAGMARTEPSIAYCHERLRILQDQVNEASR